jgi:hypothetical protein
MDTAINRSNMESVGARLLRKAADLLGSEEALRHELQAPMGEFRRWIGGIDAMPRSIFLKVVDLVLELSAVQAEATKAGRATTPESSGRADKGAPADRAV